MSKVMNSFWDNRLEFWDPAVERDYWQHRPINLITKCDVMMHVFGAVGGIARSLRYMDNAKIVLFLGAIVLSRVWQICWIFSSPASYFSWRNWSIAISRVVYMAMISVVANEIPPYETTSALGTFASLMFASTAVILFAGALAHMLPFRIHVPIQFLCVCVTALFSPSYCSRWHEQSGDDFATISSGINSALGMLMLIGANFDPVRMDCSAILCLLQWSIGFLVSTAIVYSSETYSRTLYLSSSGRFMADDVRRLWSAWRRNVVVSWWFVVVGIVSVWSVLGMALSRRGQRAAALEL